MMRSLAARLGSGNSSSRSNLHAAPRIDLSCAWTDVESPETVVWKWKWGSQKISACLMVLGSGCHIHDHIQMHIRSEMA